MEFPTLEGSVGGCFFAVDVTRGAIVAPRYPIYIAMSPPMILCNDYNQLLGVRFKWVVRGVTNH